MRPRLGRSLIGYAAPATRVRLAEIESELDARWRERDGSLRELGSRLEEAQSAVSEIERAIAEGREEHRALLAVFETMSSMSRDIVQGVEAELKSEEAELLSALAQRKVLLGERRSLVALFRTEVDRLIRDTRHRLAQQGHPATAGRAVPEPAPSAGSYGESTSLEGEGPHLSRAGG